MKTKWMFAIMVSVWIICGYILWEDWQERDQALPVTVHEEETEEKLEQVAVNIATIGMIGDVLLHYPINTYPSYDFAFEAVKEKMAGIDFLLANQESMPGGVELGLSTYPKFNSPKHIIQDLQSAGVDMISLANNHTLDKGEIGVLKSIQHAQEYAMPYVGAYESIEDQEYQRIVEVNGIQIGVLAYTYGTNVGSAPYGKEYLVNMMDRVKIAEDIRRLKPIVDVTVVSLHWGPEYSLSTSDSQEELAEFVANNGADIIFGHHPHVLQRYGEVGNAKVFFSLGNFYSAQPFEYTNFGGIARLTVKKEKTGDTTTVSIDDPRLFPTAVIKDEQNRFKVVPLRDANHVIRYTEEWVEDHVGVPAW
ncbi:CapA family protein [Sporosarcina newyorkensis]|nr:CapA family protein [Sporosarcina newyorkensis]